MRAEHVEAMERTEALMREARGRKPGYDLRHPIRSQVVGLLILASVVGVMVIGEPLLTCGIPLACLLALAIASFIRDRAGW